MADVKVILRQDVPNLGSAGEIKQVAPGYFRNYLMPRGLAVEATKGQVRALESDASMRTKQKSRAKDQTSVVAERLEGQTIRIPVRVGEQGRIYGSVTNKDLSDALAQQADLTIDRHKIDLPDPLKSVGTHTVPVKLEHGVGAQIRVELVPEEESAQA
ncbi:MAG: 50S ribosomal protein L9 [Chloroflexota bacterium]|nr:MAG: 50S ribosomal protein L9 [Chloroflexota bacterium]